MFHKRETSSERGKAGGFFINRNFALLWSGQAVSVVGDYVFQTILVLWITTVIARGQSWAPLAVSGVLLASSVPTFLIGPIAGVFADRWDRRLLMMRMDALRAVLILFLIFFVGAIPLPFLVGGHLPIMGQLGMLYGSVFLISVCDQFFNPANMAYIGHIVEEPYRARASGLDQVTRNLALVVGPALGALLFLSVGIAWGLLVDALSFAISLLAIGAIRASHKALIEEGQMQRPSFRREFLEGLRFYAGNRVLMTILVTGVIVLLGAGAFNALNIFFVTQNLHASPSIYGVLGSAAGCGAIVGAVFATAFAQRLGVVRVFWISVLAVGVVVLLFARTTSVIPALVLAFLMGFTNTPINVTLMPLVLHVTPKGLVGRVVAVLSPMMSAASTLSIALAGYLASTVLHTFHTNIFGIAFGPVDTIFTCAGLLAVLAGFYAMVSLRGIRLEDRSETSHIT
ncbi:MAG: MFS transporter [Chloroflexota bacterium]|nr:MFS transporter [Chloroflexota bacterium]